MYEVCGTVEQRKQPNIRGLPSAVVQYNEWKGGGLIAVSYEARKYGVKRYEERRSFPLIFKCFIYHRLTRCLSIFD